MCLRLFSYFWLNKVFFNASPPFFIVIPLPFNATRCSITPANRKSSHSNRHWMPLRHPSTLTHSLLFSLHRILGHSITIVTPFRRLLMPFNVPLSPFMLLDRPLMPLWCPLTLFRCPLMPSCYRLTHPVTLERILLTLLYLPIAF